MPLAAAFRSLARPRARLRSPRSCPCSCSYHLVCAHAVVCSLCARPRHLVPARLCWFQPVRAGPRYLLVRLSCRSFVPAWFCAYACPLRMCSPVFARAGPATCLLRVRARSRPFVCMFVPVFACPAVRVYSLGFAAACLFVLVRARLSGFVCIKYTVSTTSYLRNSPL
jgi:hypothetical protein